MPLKDVLKSQNVLQFYCEFLGFFSKLWTLPKKVNKMFSKSFVDSDSQEHLSVVGKNNPFN